MEPSPPGRVPRLLGSTGAVLLLAIRLALHPDALDPLAWFLLAAALFLAHPGRAWRRAVIGGAAAALAILCLQAQMFHMLASANLVK